MTDKITPFPIPDTADPKSVLQLIAAKDPDMIIVLFEESDGDLQRVYRAKEDSHCSIHETMGMLQAAALSFYEES